MSQGKLPKGNSFIKKLDEIVLYGVAHDLYACIRALNIYNTIAENAAAIEARHFAQSFFGAVQHMAMGEVFLSLARAFETPKRNELRSIPHALEYMSKNAHLLPVHNRNAIYAVRPELRQNQRLGQDKDFTAALVTRMRAEFTNLPALAALQVLRDKMLAHSDLKERPTETGIKFADLDVLIAFGLDLVTIAGEGYVGTTVTSDTGPHFVIDGAEVPSFSLSRLLRLAGLEVKKAWLRHENELKKPTSK